MRIILGVDPGTLVMGYGILKIENNKPELVTMGVLNMKKCDDPYQNCILYSILLCR